MNKQLIDDSEPVSQSAMGQQVFNLWAENTFEHGVDRFFSKNRDGILEDLINSFIDFGVNYNTAIGFTKKLIDILVTKEGKKGQGKYKRWKEDVEREYSAMLLEIYSSRNLPILVEDIEYKNTTSNQISVSVPDHTTEFHVPASFDTVPTYGDHMHLDKNQLISAWAKYRFGSFYNNQLDLLAHRVGSELNILFQKEVLFSDWLTAGNNAPAWAEGYY